MDLTVEIEGDIGTLEEALHQFTRTEILDGENKYQCSRLVWLLRFMNFLSIVITNIYIVCSLLCLHMWQWMKFLEIMH